MSNTLAALTYHSGLARVFAGRSSWSPWVAAARSDCRRSGRVVTQGLRPDIVEGEAVKGSAIALGFRGPAHESVPDCPEAVAGVALILSIADHQLPHAGRDVERPLDDSPQFWALLDDRAFVSVGGNDVDPFIG